MACVCKQMAGEEIELSPICIGHLWIFQYLEAEEVEVLTRAALRKRSTKGQAQLLQTGVRLSSMG